MRPTGGGGYREPQVFKGFWLLGQYLLTCSCLPYPQQVSRAGQTGSSRDRGARLSAWLRCNSIPVVYRPFIMFINMVSCVCSGDLVATAATCGVGGGRGLFLLFDHLTCCVARPPRLFHLEVGLPHL